MLGRHDEAGQELSRAVPAGLLDTRFGLPYLHARGLHNMAVGHPHAALADFEDCGRLMSGWGIDLPALVPWRSGAAEALIELGHLGQARELVEQQLGRPGVAGSRTRGVSLRILAACTDEVDRGPLLREAVELLRAEDDPLELATALADLSNANHLLGELAYARLLADQALQVVESSQVEESYWQRSVADGQLAALADNGGVSVLSPAEEPVARLAAAGHTNREISRKLFITVSTVEQHLTRIYRKLHVRSRNDLAAYLNLQVSERASA
jgi:DNA-binding CsgD family transcriptional regulator